MRIIAVLILLCFAAAQIHAKELVLNNIVDLQDKLINRKFKRWVTHRGVMDNTTVGKKSPAKLLTIAMAGVMAGAGARVVAAAHFRGPHCPPKDSMITDLITTLRVGNLEAKADATSAISNLTSQNQNADLIRQEGGIQLLIEVLREDGLEVQEKAAAALGGLALNGKNQDVIREAGGIVALTEVLRNCSQRVRQEVTQTLLIISRNSQSRAAICHEDGVPLLIEVLREGDQAAQALAAAALGNLAVASLGRKLIRQENGTRILMQLLSDGGQDAQATAAGALSNLVLPMENVRVADTNTLWPDADVMRQEGGIEALIDLLQKGNQKARANAVLALANLGMNEDNHEAICEHGGIKALTEVLREGTLGAKTDVVTVLENLARSTYSQDAWLEEGGIQALIKVVQEESEEIQAKAWYTLQVLTQNDNYEKIINDGIEHRAPS